MKLNGQDMKIASSLPVVVQHEFLGAQAVSVPLRVDGEHEGRIVLSVSRQDIEERLDEAELNHHAPTPTRRPDDIPNDRLKAAIVAKVEAGEYGWTTLASRMNWTRQDKGKDRPDGRRVKRALGLTSDRQHYISPEIAAALASVANLDPHEAGI